MTLVTVKGFNIFVYHIMRHVVLAKKEILIKIILSS